MEGQTASVTIAAPPETVWDILTDVRRTGEWSPVCYRCEWIGGSSGAEAGARFKGWNKQGPARWTRECLVDEAERGAVFAFHTLYKGRVSTRWRYTFEPADDGTRLTESYQPVFAPVYVRIAAGLAPKRSAADSRRNIETSLQRLKQAAEAQRSA